MLLEGKRLVVTGVLNEQSIAFSVARLAQEAGAELVLTGFGRGLRITERIAKRLPEPPPVLELDVTVAEHHQRLAADLGERWGAVDGLVHAVAFAPEAALGGSFLDTAWEDAATALHVSTYSFASLSASLAPLLRAAGGGAVVGLDFDGTRAWPAYDWMGVAKAGLEATSRYVARDLGPQGTRVNLVAAGPLRTVAAKGIDGFEDIERSWGAQAPLGWDVTDAEPVARTVCALLSDWLPATTGMVVHADGGAHAIGAPPPPASS